MKKSEIVKTLREKIRVYYENFHKPAKFIPGKTRVPYAGRVYDSAEMIVLLDSLLDFWLTSGHLSAALERKFKRLLKSREFLLVNSGSSANLLIIASLCANTFRRKLNPGDEVITPAVTFPTTLAPLVQYGLVPVFIDSCVGTYNINEELIEKAVSRKTRAVFVPHTLGNPCDMNTIMGIARKKRLIVIEDACDALGSFYDNKLVGTFGRMSSFSFYPAHHMTLGEGGGVAINSQDLVKPALSLRDWGRDCSCSTGQDNRCGRRFAMKMGDLPYGYDHKYIYSNIGYNLKVTEMQSAIGLAQFEKLDEFGRRRKDNFKRYYAGLLKFDEHLVLPRCHPKAQPCWFGFPLTVRGGVKRLKLIKWLNDSKIDTRLLFGGNIIRQPGFKGIKHRVSGNLKGSDRIMSDTFFIGVYPGLTSQMIDYALARFTEFFKRKSNLR